MAASVSGRCQVCIKTLKTIISILSNPDREDSWIHHEQVNDLLERLGLWIGNAGALNRPESSMSLESRLREEKDILTHTLELLDDLNEVANEVLQIVSGQREGGIASAPSKDNNEEVQIEEIELLEEFEACIARLFRVSGLIRRAAPTDLFIEALNRNENDFNDQFDIVRVGEKHPKLATEDVSWLRRRLGRAITQRRRYLSYIRDHHKVLEEISIQEEPHEHVTRDLHAPTNHPSDVNLLHHSSSQPATITTKASSLEPARIIPQLLPIKENSDPESDAISYTTVSGSIDGDLDSSTTVRIPKLDDIRKEPSKEFKCPFCFRMKTFKHERLWRRHVFSDLRPYVCTFPDCEAPYFGDLNEWFHHEMQIHRVNYVCQICKDKTFQLREHYIAHCREQHFDILENGEEQPFIDLSRRPLDQIPVQECPCCWDWVDRLKKRAAIAGTPLEESNHVLSVTPTEFKRHLASHLEQLALLAIPIESAAGDDFQSDFTVDERIEYLECCRLLQRNSKANSRRKQIDDPVAGTIDWLWNHETYTRWNDCKSGVLIIQGKPGSGKSVLAKAISNEYEKHLAHNPGEDRPLISSWFYSTRGGPAAQLHENLLQAVILQWLDQDAELWSTVRPVWRENFAAGTFSTFETLSEVLARVVGTGRKIMTIVDAIDESSSDSNHDKDSQLSEAVQRKDVLEKFQELASSIPSSSAKFIILSRPIRAFAELPPKQTAPNYFMITMEKENRDALAIIIADSLKSLEERMMEEKGEGGELSPNENDSLERVNSYLTNNSDGVILWPKLIINDLASALEEDEDFTRDLSKRLASYPRDLTELYKEMVERINSSEPNDLMDARHLLMWISGSPVAFQRPITIGALYETSWITTYEINRHNFETPFSEDTASASDLAKFEHRLRRLCGTFINVQRKPKLSGHRTDTVELGHRTMKDFLAGPDAGKLGFSQNDALETMHKQSVTYSDMLKEYLVKYKNRATSSDTEKDLKVSIWNFFDLIERRMFLDLGCTACDTGSRHKYGLHCPYEILGRSIENLETEFESMLESSASAGFAVISKTLKLEEERTKARGRDKLLNDLLPISAFLAREESPTAVIWEEQFDAYLPRKQRKLFKANKSLFLMELIYWACMFGKPATAAHLIQPFLWKRFSNIQSVKPSPYRNMYLDLIRASILAGVDVGLDRIFYDHLFEYPALLYTITERMQQLKHNGVEHGESMKRLRMCGRSLLKGYIEENQQHSHDCGTPQDGSNAHGALLKGQEERREDDKAKMQRDIRNIYTTLNSMASSIRGSRHDDIWNDELKLANTCEAVSLVLREAEILLICVTHHQDSSGKLLAPPDISILRNRHDWKKYIRERSVAGRFGIHHHILGAVDRVFVQESDFARFWPKEKPIKLAEDLAREENAGEKERKAPMNVGDGSGIDLKKRIPKFSTGWGRK